MGDNDEKEQSTLKELQTKIDEKYPRLENRAKEINKEILKDTLSTFADKALIPSTLAVGIIAGLATGLPVVYLGVGGCLGLWIGFTCSTCCFKNSKMKSKLS